MTQVIKNYVNNQFVETQEGKTAQAFNPATGKALATVPLSGNADVDAAVKAAQSAFPQWSKTTREQRIDILMTIAQLIEANMEELAKLEAVNMGKSLPVARADMRRQLRNFREFAHNLYSLRETKTDYEGTLNYTQRFPVGVVAIIGSWSRPLHQILWRLVPALAMGNTVVAKPPRPTPCTTFLFTQILAQSGVLPPGVFNVVYGAGEEVGHALAGHSGVNAIGMVGGDNAAAEIIKAAASGIKKMAFDLGNSHAMCVFEDADLTKLVPEAVRAAFLYDNGQRAHCPNRIFVHQSIAKEFTDKFVEATKKLKLGDPAESDAEIGPIVSKQQLDIMINSLKVAQEEGAVVLCGGQQPQMTGNLAGGYWFTPTVLGGLSATSKVNKERSFKTASPGEIQGPIVRIVTFTSESEVIEAANNGSGLSASVWTKDLSRAHRVAGELRTGYVWVNSWLIRDLRMPFGGVGIHGLGKSGTFHSLDFYSEIKTVCINISGGNTTLG